MSRLIGFLTVALCVACGVAQAKTVALWPLEKTSSGGFDAGCVVNPANDLVFDSRKLTVVDQELGWDLPPNPDTARHAKTPVNKFAVKSLAGGGGNFLYNDTVGDYLVRNRAFTVEGYLKIMTLPASNSFALVMGGFDDDSNSPHRWTLTFRRRASEDYACTWLLWANGNDGDRMLYNYGTEEASYAITNVWLHVALVHEPIANARETWKLYFNGSLAGELELNSRTTDPGAHRFSLGARGQGDPLSAVFDYWRVSDEALAPEEFLCAGETGTTVTSSPTVAYWPLNVTASGGVDGRDAVGDSPFTSGYYGMDAFRACRMGASEECAFPGNPPNNTVSLEGGNAGCLQGSATAGCLQHASLGANLNVNLSFTVEGWFAPRIWARDTIGNNEVVAYLFGTRPEGNEGWVLAYRTKGAGNFLFDIYCVDQVEVLQNNAKLSGNFDVKGWFETWHHLALVYDATGGDSGHGRWALYIDGQLTGTVDNARAASPLTAPRPFFLGGRANTVNQSFQGRIDCVRVSQAVLSPNQFLCATENAAAVPDTDVLALWPLNVSDGYRVDLRDVSGKGHDFAPRDGGYDVQRVKGVPDQAPVIANPDRSPDFRGDATHVNGCAQFRNPSDGNQHRAYLMTCSATVMNALARGKEFTLECYYRRLTETTQGQEVIFIAANETSARTRIFRKADGLFVWDGMHGDQKDQLIPGTSDSDLLPNIWYHIALVHKIETVEGLEKKQTVWYVYVDGVLKGRTAVNLYDNSETARQFQVGGRYWTDHNSVNGHLSSVRLSRGALDPSEFLCATPAAPAPDALPKTEGYWPIDATGAALGNLAAADYPLVAVGMAAAQETQAWASIPNDTALTNLVTGAARRNQGSYALGAGGVLAVEGPGFALSLREPFTVEGWVKWNPSDATQEADLVSAGDVDADGGVRLFLDRSGAVPCLRIKGTGVWPCTPFLDATFDADLSMLPGEWAHIAVAYDSTDGMGSWTLFVDGRQLGKKVYNFYKPTAFDHFRSGTFRIGSTSHPLEGSVDMWRLPCGTLTAENLLYATPKGVVIFIR